MVLVTPVIMLRRPRRERGEQEPLVVAVAVVMRTTMKTELAVQPPLDSMVVLVSVKTPPVGALVVVVAAPALQVLLHPDRVIMVAVAMAVMVSRAVSAAPLRHMAVAVAALILPRVTLKVVRVVAAMAPMTLTQLPVKRVPVAVAAVRVTVTVAQAAQVLLLFVIRHPLFRSVRNRQAKL